MIQEIKKAFLAKFGNDPILFKSPGRVNLIGEHTDYNEGFVLPASVDKAIYFAVKPNNLDRFRFYAIDLDETHETNKIDKCDKAWANYLLGVIAQFKKDGKDVPPFDCVFGGDVPLGAGMSSSAAIECGMAYAINYFGKFNYPTLQLVKFAQKAEHEYAGVQCGIMDQFASMHGKANQVIKLDCRTHEYELFPFDMTNHRLVLVNTGVKHSLASSEYNKRRQECEAGVEVIKKHHPEVNSLRDITLEMLNQHKEELSNVVYSRCSYVIEENQRLEEGTALLLKGDFEGFGREMYGSHEGLKNKYEVSCNELDELVELARNTNGVLGARMMGGGFGGCTINLIQKEAVKGFIQKMEQEYKTPDQKKPQIIEVVIDEGTSLINNA